MRRTEIIEMIWRISVEPTQAAGRSTSAGNDNANNPHSEQLAASEEKMPMQAAASSMNALKCVDSDTSTSAGNGNANNPHWEQRVSLSKAMDDKTVNAITPQQKRSLHAVEYMKCLLDAKSKCFKTQAKILKLRQEAEGSIR